MGYIINYVHKECNFDFEFFEGVGFGTFAMECESRKYMREGEWGEHWKNLIEQHPDGTATLNQALCYCEKCKKYFNEPRIEFYIPKEGYHYIPNEGEEDGVPSYIVKEHYQLLEKEVIKCPECDTIAKIMQKTSQIPCPVCGKKIKGEKIGCWD